MVLRCSECDSKVDRAVHTNPNLGPFSFEEVCDDCQVAHHNAFRAAKAAQAVARQADVAKAASAAAAAVADAGGAQ